MAFSKKRILIFSYAYAPFESGAEIAVRKITGRLGDRFQFDLLTYRFDPSWPREERNKSMQVFRLGKGSQEGFLKGKIDKFWWSFQAWLKAEKLHRQHPYDAVWAVMAAYAGPPGLVFKLFHPQVRLLVTLQEGDSESHILKRVGMLYPFWRLFFKKADYLQCISNYLADLGRRHGAESAIEIIPNGVDLSLFSKRPSPDEVKALQSKLGITPDAKVIITTSRLSYKNGIDVLLKALAHLKKTTQKVTCVIIGGGEDEEKLKKLAKDIGVEKEVRFLGSLPIESIPPYLHIGHLFVRPSRSEGLGTSFLEAMAAGLPIIGTSVGGIPDFLKDRKTGLFCRVDDSQDLSEKIKLFLFDEKLRETCIRNSKTLVQHSYSWDTVAGKMGAILDRLLGRKKMIYLTHTRLPTEKAHGLATMKIAEALAKKGYELEMIVPWRRSALSPDPFAYYGVERVFRIKKIPNIDLLSVPFLQSFFFYLHTFSFILCAILFILFSKGRRFREYIFFSHDHLPLFVVSFLGAKIFYDIHDFPVENVFYRRVLQKSFGLAVQTKRKIAALGERFGVPAEKVVYWPNGTDVAFFRQDISKKEARDQLHLPLEEKIAVYLGHLFGWKGVDTLAKSTPFLDRDSEVYIVGGTDGDQTRFSDFIKKEHFLRITLIPFQNREKILLWLKAADVLILPNTAKEDVSKFYTSPMKMFEYMASGRPTVASRISSLTEILNEDNAFLFEADNPEDLARVIMSSLNDFKESKKRAKKAQADVGIYTWDERAKKIIGLMEK